MWCGLFMLKLSVMVVLIRLSVMVSYVKGFLVLSRKVFCRLVKVVLL